MNIAILVLAMVQASPAEKAEMKATTAKVIACINTETEKLAPLTTEPASDLASVAADRCRTDDVSTQALFTVLPVKKLANERILRLRTGDKTPIADPLAAMQ